MAIRELPQAGRIGSLGESKPSRTFPALSFSPPRHSAPAQRRHARKEPQPFLTAALRAQRYLRLAIVFFGAAVLIHFLLLFFIPGLRHGQWRGEMGGFFVILSLMFLAAFPVAFILLWSLGLKAILLASGLFHLVFGRNAPADAWQERTCHALWPLPYASALGGLVHLIYHIFRFGGWPDDVIFGAIGNLLGAWCYLTIFWSWYRLATVNESLPPTEPPPRFRG